MRKKSILKGVLLGLAFAFCLGTASQAMLAPIDEFNHDNDGGVLAGGASSGASGSGASAGCVPYHIDAETGDGQHIHGQRYCSPDGSSVFCYDITDMMTGQLVRHSCN